MLKQRASKGANHKSAKKIAVRQSRVHGRGVFATARIRKGEKVIEYTGTRLPWQKAQRLPPHDPNNPYHTFFFSLDDGDVINAAVAGNEARWINHSCDPNCETSEKKGRMFIYANRTLRPGEELFYDYKLVPAERRTRRLEKAFACYCGAANCRGTMLAPK